MTQDEKDAPAGLLGLVVDRPVAVTMIFLAVAVFGWVSFQRLSLTLLPRISYPSLTVRTEFPGSAPAEVEELVTKPLESNLAVISNLSSYRSISRAGVSDLILEFEWDTDMNFATQDVREKVDLVRAFLPQDVAKPLILKYDPTLDPIMRLGLSGDTDLTRTRFQAEERIKKELESIPGVAAVRVRGGFESEVRVELDERALRRLDVTVAQIQQRLAEENVNLPSGLIREGDVEYLVRTLNQFKTVAEIRALIIEERDGAVIRLGDLALVDRDDKEPDVITRIDGEPSVELAVYKEDAANIVAVANRVKEAVFGGDWRARLAGETPKARATRGPGQDELARLTRSRPLAERLPEGMSIRLLSDQSRFIENSISEVKWTGILGALVAIAVLLAFLRDLTATTIIAVAIPISVIATFGPMMSFDVSLNIMSLGGLALGIGMLVDASIVVLESIDRCKREGDDLRPAAIRGTREVAGAVTASVLTTIAVFFPIVFVEGIAGEIFKDQSLTVVFSLLASLAVALLFIPMLAARKITAPARREPRARLRGAFTLIGQRLAARPGLIAGLERYAAGLQRSGRVGRVLRLPLAPFLLLWLSFGFALEMTGRVLFTLTALAALVIGGLLWAIHAALRLLAWPFAFVFDRGYALIEAGYTLVLRLALGQRLLVVMLAIALSWLAWTRLGRIGIDLVPALHSGELIVEAPQPVGSSLMATAAVTEEIEARIDRLRAERDDLVLLGHASAVGVARDEIAPAGEGPHTAKIYLSLPIVPDMEVAESRLIEALRAELSQMAEVSELAFEAPKLFTFKNPIEVQVKGDDLERIDRLGRRIEAAMRAIAGLDDVRSTVQEGSPEFVIEYDRLRLAERGLRLADAAGQLRDKIKGIVPTRYSVPGEARKIDVLVKIPEERVGSAQALGDIEVGRSNGRPVLLGEVASIVQGRGPAEIRRIGGQRSVVLSASNHGVDLKTAAGQIRAAVDAIRDDHPADFRGVVVEVSGQSEEAEHSTQELLFALALALVLVYIVMASQFESLLDPLIIMVSSIFAGVGAIFALDWLGIAASVVVFIGGIMLAGIVVNNAIVLIDRIERLRRGGMDKHAAIVAAGEQRLRPILMTTLTTVLGLVPMAMSTGEGAEMRMPMAVTVIAGLSTSTLLTLVIIPVVYSLAHGLTDRFRRPGAGS
ncbi:MAG: efflux RND transporter permease subunit [Planctomycetes bacterium]|nr:efflux RND transporter permease subunit [Planctomycetota bacterium]